MFPSISVNIKISKEISFNILNISKAFRVLVLSKRYAKLHFPPILTFYIYSVRLNDIKMSLYMVFVTLLYQEKRHKL